MRRSKGNRNGSVPPNSTVSVEVEVVRVRNKKPVSLDYLHLKFLTIHAHCSTTLIATQDIVYTDCNSGHRHWAGILGEVGRGHCAPSKWTSMNLHLIKCQESEIYYCQKTTTLYSLHSLRASQMDVDRPASYQMSTIRNTKPYYCQPLHYIQTFSPTY